MTLDAREIRRTVGANVRTYRLAIQMSVADFGELMGDILGTRWIRQTVSAAEAGNRAFTAVDLVALTQTLGVSLEDLFRVVHLPDEVADGSTPKQRLEAAKRGRPSLLEW